MVSEKLVSMKLAKRAVLYCASIVVALAAVYVILVATGRIPLPGACITEEKMRIPNLSGMEFEVTYTNCDTLAKQEAISIYVSRAAVNGESLFARWLNRKTLLFRYDPARWDSPAPSINATGNGRILISIPEVSSVFFQTRKWRNVSVDYNIGHTDYP